VIHKLKELFSIDIRSLAILRIGMAFFVLVDLFYRSFDVTAFYTDAGVIPRSLNYWKPHMSIHFLSGSLGKISEWIYSRDGW